MAYHGNTFVADMTSSSSSLKNNDRHSRSMNGHLGGKSIGQSSSASQIQTTSAPSKGPSVVSRPGEYVPYTGSSFSGKTPTGPNIMVAGERQKESLEEEAKSRSLKRQSNLSRVSGLSHNNSGSSEGKSPAQQLSTPGPAPTANNGKPSRQECVDYTYYGPTAPNQDQLDSDQNFRQYSSSAMQQGTHSANSSIRLNKQNLVFRATEGVKVQTPRENAHFGDHDCHGIEMGDGNEVMTI